MEGQSYWAHEEKIGEVVLSDAAKEVVQKVQSKDGDEFIDIRRWYRRKKDIDWNPGKGHAIPVSCSREVLTMAVEALGGKIIWE